MERWPKVFEAAPQANTKGFSSAALLERSIFLSLLLESRRIVSKTYIPTAVSSC